MANFVSLLLPQELLAELESLLEVYFLCPKLLLQLLARKELQGQGTWPFAAARLQETLASGRSRRAFPQGSEAGGQAGSRVNTRRREELGAETNEETSQ